MTKPKRSQRLRVVAANRKSCICGLPSPWNVSLFRVTSWLLDSDKFCGSLSSGSVCAEAEWDPRLPSSRSTHTSAGATSPGTIRWLLSSHTTLDCHSRTPLPLLCTPHVCMPYLLALDPASAMLHSYSFLFMQCLPSGSLARFWLAMHKVMLAVTSHTCHF